MDRTELKNKVLQTFVVTVREINRHGGPEEFFQKYPVGGMYYAPSHEDTDFRKATSVYADPEYLAACRKHTTVPLLVCCDWAELPGQTVEGSVRSVGGTGSEADAYALGRILGMQCNAADMDWLLQPAVDMYYNSSMPFFAMSGDVETTARLFRQVVRGIQDQGVCATVKHFPGLGTSNTNMHHAPGANILPFDEWMASYGYVYKQMFAEDVCAVMSTHTMLRSFDPDSHDGYLPIATYSEKLTQGLLKETLGFSGAVVTDALIMGGMATGDLVAETVRAFQCGADLLLWPPMEAADAIVDELESGRIPMRRLEDALARIQRMRDFRSGHKRDIPDPDFANSAARDMIRRGVCLYKNELGLVPISKDVKKILILDAAHGAPSQLLGRELGKRGFAVDVKDDIYDHDFYVCWQAEIDVIAAQYDLVILCADPGVTDDTHNSLFMMIWASHLFSKQKKIVINFNKPFVTLNYFPEELTLIEANNDPTEETVRAIADGLVGEMEFTGNFVL